MPYDSRKETELLRSDVARLSKEVSSLRSMLSGGGAIVNHGKRLDVDISCRLSELLKRQPSGVTIEDLAPLLVNYLYKPGIRDGQTAYGGINPGGNLTFDSTKHTIKGEIRAGSKTVVTASDSLPDTVNYPLRIVHEVI